jgi:tetratricopeptide (TPR) repeat protein
VVGGLGHDDARELLASVIRGPLDELVGERIVAETRGNPLALLELPRGFRPAELAGGFGLGGTLSLSGRIEESFQRRLEALPAETQRLLLVAAAEPVGDPLLVWRAAKRIGMRVEAGDPAAAAGLVEFGRRVRFRHPLVRSAVYRAASPGDRRRVHGALAEATDPRVDPDRRAWHRAQATPGPDEDVAAELERSAGRAQARGGLAAAAAFLERAVELTLDPARRGERALAAAQAKQQAGAPDAALGLLAIAEEGPLDELQRARADLLSAQIAFAVNRGSDAPPLLLRAAKRLEPLDVVLARETYLDAFGAAMFAGRLSSGVGVLGVAEAARAAPSPPQPPRPADLLLDGLALLLTEGYTAGGPTLKRALSAFRDKPGFSSTELRWAWLAGRIAINLWDYETWAVLTARHVQVARETGALSELPVALNSQMGVETFAGELAAASSLVEELETVSGATGSHFPPYGALALAAFRGREAEVVQLTGANVEEIVRRGEGMGVAVTQWASALLYNGLGRYENALAAAEQASEYPEELALSTWVLVELIEAAARAGRPARAAEAIRQLSETTRAGGTDWALGIEARSRALLSERETAERRYREAIDRLGRTRVRVELARAPCVRRVAAPRAPATGRARAAAHRPRAVRVDGDRGVRRARRPRAARHRRARPQTHRPDQRPAHRAGDADRAARPRRPLQPRDRRPPVHQPAHRRVPPAQGLHQARHQLAQPARPRPPLLSHPRRGR